MRPKFSLSLGERDVAVINWINWRGDLHGRNLRFTVPLDSKSLLESNMDSTFKLVDPSGTSWNLELKSVEPHHTGTTGVKVAGLVTRAAQPAPEPKEETQAPAPDAEPEEHEAAAAAPDTSDDEHDRTEDASDAEASDTPAPAKRKLPSSMSIPMPKSLSEVSEVAPDGAKEASAEEE